MAYQFSLKLSFALALLIFPGGSPLVQSQATKPQTESAAQEPVLRIQTDLVQVHAVVRDKQGRLVTNLRQEDFEVYENGRRQEISFFSVENLGVTASGDAAQAAARREAQQPSPSPQRSIVLFVDTLNLSVSSLARIRPALRKFIDEQVTEQDVVAVVPTYGTLGALQQYTTDKELLRYAIERLRSGASSRDSVFTPFFAGMLLRRDPDAVGVARQFYEADETALIPEITGRDPLSVDMIIENKAQATLAEAIAKRRLTLGALQAVLKQLAELPGQRLVLMVSDGFSLMGESGEFQTAEIEAVVGQAGRAGILLHALDARGLEPDAGFRADVKLSLTTTAITYFLKASREDLRNGLNALARDSGGQFIFNTNDLDFGLQKMLDEHRFYYALAYYPPDEPAAKKATSSAMFRHLSVRVKDHPDYEVRAQKGYAVVARPASARRAATPQQRLTEALRAPLPGGDIPVTLSPDYLELATDNAQVSLQIHIDGAALAYAPRQEQSHLQLDLVTLIYDLKGKLVHSAADKLEGLLPPERLAQVKENGLRQVKRLALKPGLYQVRVGVRDRVSERQATAFDWLEIPNRKRRALTLSSLQLMETTDDKANPKDAALYYPKVARGISRYRRGSSLVYFLALYDSTPPARRDATIEAEVIRDGVSLYRSGWQSLASRLIQEDRIGKQLGGQVHLALPPGIYELRVTVNAETARQPLQQSTLFEITDAAR